MSEDRETRGSRSTMFSATTCSTNDASFLFDWLKIHSPFCFALSACTVTFQVQRDVSSLGFEPNQEATVAK